MEASVKETNGAEKFSVMKCGKPDCGSDLFLEVVKVVRREVKDGENITAELSVECVGVVCVACGSKYSMDGIVSREQGATEVSPDNDKSQEANDGWDENPRVEGI